MIESGSLTPGVRIDRFDLPAHTALRVEWPTAALRGLVANYHVLDSDRAHHDGAQQWLLPSWPTLRFILAPDAMALTIGTRRYDPLPTAALYGTASRAMCMTTHGGVTVGVDLTPLGWARLFDLRADLYRDRVVALETVLPPGWVARTMQRLRDSDQGAGVKPILDEMLLTIVAPPTRDDSAITALQRLIADDATRELTAASVTLGVTPEALRRLSTRYFGFPPKTLLIRTRFLRSLIRMLLAGSDADYSAIAPTYFDASHFLRDADRFLGTTPRRFLRQEHRFLAAFLRATAEVRRAARAGQPEPAQQPPEQAGTAA